MRHANNRNYQMASSEKQMESMSTVRPPRAVSTARGPRKRIGAKASRRFETTRVSGTYQLTQDGGYEMVPVVGEATGRSSETQGQARRIDMQLGSLNQIDQADFGGREKTFEYMMQDRNNTIKISSRTRKPQPNTARSRTGAAEHETRSSLSVNVRKSAAGGGVNLKLAHKAENSPRQKTIQEYRTKVSRQTSGKDSIQIRNLQNMNAQAIFSGINAIPGCSALLAVQQEKRKYFSRQSLQSARAPSQTNSRSQRDHQLQRNKALSFSKNEITTQPDRNLAAGGAPLNHQSSGLPTTSGQSQQLGQIGNLNYDQSVQQLRGAATQSLKEMGPKAERKEALRTCWNESQESPSGSPTKSDRTTGEENVRIIAEKSRKVEVTGQASEDVPQNQGNGIGLQQESTQRHGRGRNKMNSLAQTILLARNARTDNFHDMLPGEPTGRGTQEPDQEHERDTALEQRLQSVQTKQNRDSSAAFPRRPAGHTQNCYRIPSLSKCLEFEILPRNQRYLNEKCKQIVAHPIQAREEASNHETNMKNNLQKRADRLKGISQQGPIRKINDKSQGHCRERRLGLESREEQSLRGVGFGGVSGSALERVQPTQYKTGSSQTDAQMQQNPRGPAVKSARRSTRLHFSQLPVTLYSTGAPSKASQKMVKYVRNPQQAVLTTNQIVSNAINGKTEFQVAHVLKNDRRLTTASQKTLDGRSRSIQFQGSVCNSLARSQHTQYQNLLKRVNQKNSEGYVVILQVQEKQFDGKSGLKQGRPRTGNHPNRNGRQSGPNGTGQEFGSLDHGEELNHSQSGTNQEWPTDALASQAVGLGQSDTIFGGRAIKLQSRFCTKAETRQAQVGWMSGEANESGERARKKSLVYSSQSRDGRKSRELERDSPSKRVAVEVDYKLDQSSGVYSSSVGQSKTGGAVSGMCYSPRLRHHQDEMCLSYPRSHQTLNSMNFESPLGKAKNSKNRRSLQNDGSTRKVRQNIQIKNALREVQAEGRDTYRGYGEKGEGGRPRPYFLQLPREGRSDDDGAQGSPFGRSQGHHDLSAIRDVNTSGGSAQTSNKPLLLKVSIPQSSKTAARQLPQLLRHSSSELTKQNHDKQDEGSLNSQGQHDVSLLLSHSETGDASKPRKQEDSSHQGLGIDLLGGDSKQQVCEPTGKQSTGAPLTTTGSGVTHGQRINVAKQKHNRDVALQNFRDTNKLNLNFESWEKENADQINELIHQSRELPDGEKEQSGETTPLSPIKQVMSSTDFIYRTAVGRESRPHGKRISRRALKSSQRLSAARLHNCNHSKCESHTRQSRTMSPMSPLSTCNGDETLEERALSPYQQHRTYGSKENTLIMNIPPDENISYRKKLGQMQTIDLDLNRVTLPRRTTVIHTEDATDAPSESPESLLFALSGRNEAEAQNNFEKTANSGQQEGEWQPDFNSGRISLQVPCVLIPTGHFKQQTQRSPSLGQNDKGTGLTRIVHIDGPQPNQIMHADKHLFDDIEQVGGLGLLEQPWKPLLHSKSTNHKPIQLTEYNLLKHQIPNEDRVVSAGMRNSFSPYRNSCTVIPGHLGAKIAIVGPKTTKAALASNYNTHALSSLGKPRAAFSPSNNFINAKKIKLQAPSRHISKNMKDELYTNLKESQQLYGELENALRTSQALLAKGYTEQLSDQEREDLCQKINIIGTQLEQQIAGRADFQGHAVLTQPQNVDLRSAMGQADEASCALLLQTYQNLQSIFVAQERQFRGNNDEGDLSRAQNNLDGKYNNDLTC